MLENATHIAAEDWSCVKSVHCCGGINCMKHCGLPLPQRFDAWPGWPGAIVWIQAPNPQYYYNCV